MDWSLRHCARKGHVTYAPYERALRERLRATARAGDAWRCLRCGDFILGEPQGTGPADEAPLLRRGRQLRDALVLRLLAVERGVRGLLILLLAYGVYRFSNAKGSLSKLFERDLPAARPLADRLGYNIDQSGVVSTIRSALHATHGTLRVVTLALLGYGLLQLIEATGLWLLKRWGEYFAVVATSLFLPLEIYELIEKITVTRIIALVINVAAVIYLLASKRLFGLRGGKKAYEAERHSESLIEVEAAGTRAGRTAAVPQ
ncbi:MAG: DUF2127 domain-containing protein [Actinomycetota bacterium]|nr:DUF2127 domain-containing protein [Actinomycetota bacterium]